MEFVTTAPSPAATSASCNIRPISRPRMLQYPRRTPCVRPVAIDWIAPAPGETVIAIAAPTNVSQTSLAIG